MTTVLVLHYYNYVATVQRTNSYTINTNFDSKVSTCNVLSLVFLTLECVIRAEVLLADHSNGGSAQCVWLRATH